MELKDVKKGVKMVQLAFSIQIDREDLEMYSKLVLNRLSSNNVTLEEFNSSIARFIDTQDTNYKQLPTIATLLKFCNKQPKTAEQLAKEQALLVWENSYRYSEKVIFEHPTTNYVIENCFNGLSSFRWKYLNSTNENRVSDNWGQKEFIEKWVTAYDNKKEQMTPLCSDVSNSNSEIKMIGDINKISLMLENKQDYNKNILIQNLSDKMKG